MILFSPLYNLIFLPNRLGKLHLPRGTLLAWGLSVIACSPPKGPTLPCNPDSGGGDQELYTPYLVELCLVLGPVLPEAGQGPVQLPLLLPRLLQQLRPVADPVLGDTPLQLTKGSAKKVLFNSRAFSPSRLMAMGTFC